MYIYTHTHNTQVPGKTGGDCYNTITHYFSVLPVAATIHRGVRQQYPQHTPITAWTTLALCCHHTPQRIVSQNFHSQSVLFTYNQSLKERYISQAHIKIQQIRMCPRGLICDHNFTDDEHCEYNLIRIQLNLICRHYELFD